MMNKTFWVNLSLSLLIIAMFLLQFTPELEPFKYWICFVVVVMAAAVIVSNTFSLASKFLQANKENLKEKKRIGRPPVPDDEKLKQRSVRMKERQWAKVDLYGQEWLRLVVDRAKPPK